MTLNGNPDETNGYNSVIKNGDVSNADFVKSVISPIGSIVSWLKTFTNTPALPDGWVECDGSVLSDADSPYNGQTLPDLNSADLFLRGNSTSGVTGGSASHSHGAGGYELYNEGGSGWNTASVNTPLVEITEGGSSGMLVTSTSGGSLDAEGEIFKNITGTSAGAGTIPPYYSVVYIMRVK